ncbi:MAG: hypothetical protein AB2722_05725 [Candidatus Thiodiazotropha sp.]
MQDTKLDPSEIQTPLSVVYDGTDSAVAEEIRFLKSRNKESRLMFVATDAPAKGGSGQGGSSSALNGKLTVRDDANHAYTGLQALYAAHVAIGLGSWFEMCRLPGFLSVGTGIRPKE